MTFYNKIKWGLGILMVFVLIVTTNLIDRTNFVRVKDSVETIYEDRLIANDLIFKMSTAVQEKEVALALVDSIFFNQRNNKVNNDIEGFITQYEQTKLTTEERRLFIDFKRNFKDLKDSEKVFVNSNFKLKDRISNNISDIKTNLFDLSQIQINEGRRQMSISKKAIDTVELFTQIEIYILVFLAIAVQIIVMYKPKETP